MRYSSLIALFAPLAFALPAAAANWPDGARDQFLSECVSGAQNNVSADKAKAYCGCAADEVGKEFNETELQELHAKRGADITPDVRDRLAKASNACLTHLNP